VQDAGRGVAGAAQGGGRGDGVDVDGTGVVTASEHYQRAEIAQEAAASLQANRDPGPAFTVTEALLDAQVHALLAIFGQMIDIATVLREVRDEIGRLG
jgi:hypothetical protein